MKLSKNLEISNTLEKEGILSESDYNKLTKKLSRLFDDMRVSSVRKFLRFQPLGYSDYKKIKDNNQLFAKDYSILVTDLVFEFTFNSSFFPQLEQETTVLSQNIIGEQITASDPEFDLDHPFSNWYKLEEFVWPSIVLYHNQINEAVRKRILNVQPFEKDTVVEFSTSSLWRPWGCSSFHEIKTFINFGVMF